MKYKKHFVLLLVVLLMVSLVACSSKEDSDKTDESTKIEKSIKTETPVPSENQLHTNNYSESEITEKVRIIIDGKEITPEDNNGNKVETIIHDGVVYLPVKTIADVTGKAFHWDGPKYTVYLGEMSGNLQYPTKKIEDMTSINQSVKKTEKLTDNYGNRYSSAIYNDSDGYKYEYLLNMKYSKFKGTLYVPEGETAEDTRYLTIIADGNTIYTSPEITRASEPINVDVDVTGYNDVKIEFNEYEYSDYKLEVCLGDSGFYQ